ncbi:MAG: DNA polymerase/3'-5' exonuclease PolX [Bacteroidales bacterium]
MPLHNKEIAAILNEVADYLELKGENEFRVTAYRNAARTILGLSESIFKMAEDKKDIQSIPDIGESMADKISEIARTGQLKQLEKLRKQFPESLRDIMKLEQMGPQRTKALYEELNIESIEDLKKAAKEGEIEKLDGFGEKSTKKILKEIKEFSDKGGSKRYKLHEAGEMIQPMLEYLEEELSNLTLTGSYRRMKETVGDIDLICTARNKQKAMQHFVDYEAVQDVLSHGETRSSVRLRIGLQVDIRIVKKRSLGAAILYFTGSKAHTVALRKMAKEDGLKINEYGIYEGKKRLAGNTEKEMYEKLGLQYIEPELRENQGEIEAAQKDELPALVKPKDIRGDLHTHTKATDGKNTLEEMAEAAREKGYSYFAVTEHSKKVAMVGGLDEKALAKQIEEIDDLNNKIKNLKIIKGIEVDILEDGTLDLPDSILKELDLVIGSIHYNMNLSLKKQTRRILKAMENPYFNILGHPTGRMINKRSGYDIDMDEIMKEAADNGCFLEINSNPDRIDLKDKHIRKAQDLGLKLAISTDSHSTGNLEYIKYGVAHARRGWMSKDDIINTRSWRELKKLLNRN